MRRLAAGLTLLCLAAGPAAAHAFLTHAVPGVGADVAAPPANLLLSYTEGVEVAFCHVTVIDAAGHVVSGAPQPVPGQPAEMSVPLHITAPGLYHVEWHAVAVDTHKTEGNFSFTVGG